MIGKRLIWADALRGLLILLVVLGHSLQHGDYENRMLWNVIYSFHMAAFFVISGYVGYKKEYAISSLWGKSRQLLLPFVTWTLVEAFLSGNGVSSLFSAILKPDSSYWFVFVLFVILFLFTLMITICKRLKVNSGYLLSGGGNIANNCNGVVRVSIIWISVHISLFWVLRIGLHAK